MTLLHQKIIENTIEMEGGYVNDPSDAGGKTKFGISQNFNKSIDVEKLTIEDAFSIYHSKYLTPVLGIENPAMLQYVFDNNVNGMLICNSVLQTFINARLKSKLKVDGIIGPKTIMEINKLSGDDISLFLKTVDMSARKISIQLDVANQKKQRRLKLPVKSFQRGWENRIRKRVAYATDFLKTV